MLVYMCGLYTTNTLCQVFYAYIYTYIYTGAKTTIASLKAYRQVINPPPLPRTRWFRGDIHTLAPMAITSTTHRVSLSSSSYSYSVRTSREQLIRPRSLRHHVRSSQGWGVAAVAEQRRSHGIGGAGNIRTYLGYGYRSRVLGRVPAYSLRNRTAYRCRVPAEDEFGWDKEGNDVVEYGDVTGFEPGGEALGDIWVVWEERELGQGAG